MIIEQLLAEDNLTVSEKQIAHFILNKDHAIEHLTSSQLGEKSLSSQSSVIRLYKKLGFKTYREFLAALIIERNEYFKIQDMPHKHLSHYFTSFKDIQQTISRLYAEAMINTNFLINQNDIIRVCNRIMSATSIDIYGCGISDTIAKQMAFKLQSLGLPCAFQNGLNHHYIQKLNEKSNISILITLTGQNESILHFAKVLNERHVYTVAIMGRDSEELKHLCQDCLQFFSNKYDDIDVMCATFTAEYVVNMIYAILISRIQATHFQNIEKS